jgi:hypothetical protein
MEHKCYKFLPWCRSLYTVTSGPNISLPHPLAVEQQVRSYPINVPDLVFIGKIIIQNQTLVDPTLSVIPFWPVHRKVKKQWKMFIIECVLCVIPSVVGYAVYHICSLRSCFGPALGLNRLLIYWVQKGVLTMVKRRDLEMETRVYHHGG